MIFVDGGITQIEAGKRAIQNINEEIYAKIKKSEEMKDSINNEEIDQFIHDHKLEIPIFGMVKNDKHQTRALMDANRKELKISEELLKLITDFQDHVHDTAIGYHKKLRDGEVTKSILDDIEGIGPKKKIDLLKKFGSVEKIKKASVEEIVEVKGFNESLAERIKEYLN